MNHLTASWAALADSVGDGHSRLHPGRIRVKDLLQRRSTDYGGTVEDAYEKAKKQAEGDPHAYPIDRRPETGGSIDAYLDHLAADMKINGITDPVELDSGGDLYDGHHRTWAAARAGLEWIPFVYEDATWDEDDE